MEIKGEYRISAPQSAVFSALNDPDILQACIPGCETLSKISDTEMMARVRMRVGPVSASFSGKVTLSDIDPPNGYRISGEGQGGAAGFAKGSAAVKLRTDGAQTVLNYNVDAQVGGKIAQVGARLIDGTARKLADEFFGKFSAMVAATQPNEGAGDTEPAAPTVPPGPATPPPDAPGASRPRRYLHIVLTALTVAALAVIYFASR